MSYAQKLAEAKAETRRAERAAMQAEVRLAIGEDKIAAHERGEARQLKAVVQTAVANLIQSGQIAADDHAAQLDMAGQFISDPSLVAMALTKRIFRQRNSKLIQQQK